MRGNTHSFVVRIWYEVVDKEGRLQTWRGYIDYVGRDKRLYFHNLNELTGFIQEQAGVSPHCSHDKGRSWWGWLKKQLDRQP